MQKIKLTRELVTGILGPSVTEFRVNRNFTIHFTDVPTPKVPTEVIGSFGYRDNVKHAYREQFFYLSVGGEVVSSTTIKELAMVVKLGEAVERRLQDASIQVIDVRLPKSHGYTGNKYGFRQVKELFPDIA
jgi:hypothetical protein